MRYSGIGGQAVMEGVMMKNDNRYAIAVRKTDGDIVVSKRRCKGKAEMGVASKIPFVRGIVNFVDSLVMGMKAMSFSSSFFVDDEEEEKKKNMSAEERAAAKKKEDASLTVTMVISFIIAIAIFTVLPWYLSTLFEKVGLSKILISVIEGVLRVVIFIAYLVFISLLKDIRRVFMYHGAEHKCINCIEHDLELTVENVRESSRFHKRCGTSFLFIVVILSVIVFILIGLFGIENPLLKVGIRLLMIPVIAGISYEFLRLAGKHDNWFINVIAAPGLLMQRLTTREPDDSMIEVAIASVEAVFDWKEFIKSDKEAACEFSDEKTEKSEEVKS